MCKSFSVHNCREELAKMLIIEELLFKFLESIGFKNFVRTLTCGLDINFVVPSRFTMARDYILKMYVNEKQKICFLE